LNDPRLVLIEVEGGDTETYDLVRDGVAEKQTKHPVLWDKGRQNQKNYGVRAWPVSYLIDKQGRVFWEGNFARTVNRPDAAQALREKITAELTGDDGQRTTDH
jgi:hypothetical protein